MAKLEDSVNEILGLEGTNKVVQDNLEPPKDFQPPVPRKNGEISVKVEKDINTDYDYSRDSYYHLIEKGQEAIQGILDIAKEGQHPRAYEVVGQLIGQVATSVDKLQDLQKKLKDLKELPGRTNANIKNALFVGSTAELQKMLNKQSMETKKEKRIENETIDGKSESKE